MKLCNICGGNALHTLEKVYVNEYAVAGGVTEPVLVHRPLYDATGKDLCPSCMKFLEDLVATFCTSKTPLMLVLKEALPGGGA